MASIQVDAAEVEEVTKQSEESALKSPPASESQHDFLDEEESEDLVILPDEIGKDQEKPNNNHFDDDEDDEEDQEWDKPGATTQIVDEDKENIDPSTMSAGGTANEYSEEEDADD